MNVTKKQHLFVSLVLVIPALLLGYYYIENLYIQNSTDIIECNDEAQEEWCVNEPTVYFGTVVDSLIVIENKIKRNESISDILSKYNVSKKTIFELAKIAKPVFDVRKLVYNKQYTLFCSKDSLKTVQKFIYQESPLKYVVFDLQNEINVEIKEKKKEIVEKKAVGLIKQNLALSIQELGLSPQLTNDIADIFAWQIDFFRLKKGDTFKLIYDDYLVEGKSIGIGKIKSAYFEHNNNPYYAFLFDQGEGADYFDEKGNSLKKSLLRYPLKFSRISSMYSGRRYHPVLKRYKAHRGTDFAAPKGTPIRAVGDGVVLEARYKRYNGNYVKIKHNTSYSTQYLHMSKIKTGIRTGKKIKQGEIIGYVGSTGLARGNHLCYRFWKNGKQVDALKVNLPPAKPIISKMRKPFNEYVKTSILALEQTTVSII